MKLSTQQKKALVASLFKGDTFDYRFWCPECTAQALYRTHGLWAWASSYHFKLTPKGRQVALGLLEAKDPHNAKSSLGGNTGGGGTPMTSTADSLPAGGNPVGPR